MIEISQLNLIYPSGKGIFDVDLVIQDGEVFGYLGPNGAGKTTTIRGLLGFMKPTSGYVRIQGLDPQHDSVDLQRKIGYLPGEMAFFPRYTGHEFLDFMAAMRGLTDRSREAELIQRFELDVAGRINKMSKGMKQKLAIVVALMHDPEILILDEPTSGLDPLMQNRFLELIEEEKKRGKTILMSSHLFEEVERVCDRAGIIKDGRILTIEDFQDSVRTVDDIFIVTLQEPDDRLLTSGLNVTHEQDCVYHVYVKDDYPGFLKTLSDFQVVRLESHRQSLEDIFLTYYEGGED
jgi:ABC-2 type transport system ATP-binding protein